MKFKLLSKRAGTIVEKILGAVFTANDDFVVTK